MSGVLRIFDNFNRTTSGSLGTADSGQTWENIKGVWTANGSQATSSSTPSTYPIAGIQFISPNATIKADVSDGSGIAFWINDSQNWWGVANTSSITGNICSSGYTTYTAATPSYTGPGYIGNSYTAPNYTDPGYVESYCVSYTITYIPPAIFAKTCSQYSNSYIPGYTYTAGAFTPAPYTGGPYTAGTPASYSFTCTAYANTYSYALTLIKSVTNTITTVATQALSSAVASIKLILNGTSITATAHSGSGATGTTLGTITNTATGATTSVKHGIILVSSSQQQTTVDNLTIDVL